MWRNSLKGKGAILTCWEDLYHCLGLRRSPIQLVEAVHINIQDKRRGHVRETHLPWTFNGSEPHTRASGDHHCLSFWSGTHTRACFSPIAVGSVVVTTIPSLHSQSAAFILFWPYHLCWCAVWVYLYAPVTQETGQNCTALKTNWILMPKKTSLLCCMNVWLPSSSCVEPVHHEYFIRTYVRVQWRLISSRYTPSALHVQGRPVCLSCHLLFRKSVFPGLIWVICTQLAAYFYLDVGVFFFF